MGIEKLENTEVKQEKIVQMFDEIASTYDLANRVLSMGIDVKWRKIGCAKSLELFGKKQINAIVDVATGTGDLLLHWRDQANKADVDVAAFVGVDPSVGMLEVAQKKVDFATFKEGKAQQLPLEDQTADVVSISFGIRNVDERKEALREFNRVLSSGGMVMILEFTKQEKKGLVGRIVDFGMKRILPYVGGLISRNYKAYRYLPDSIEEFLTTKMLSQELEEAGFEIAHTQSFSMGISTLIIAKKL